MATTTETNLTIRTSTVRRPPLGGSWLKPARESVTVYEIVREDGSVVGDRSYDTRGEAEEVAAALMTIAIPDDEDLG